MSIHKLRDWGAWWEGLRTSALQALGESLATNISAMLATNGVASMVPAMHDYVLTWHAALMTTTTQCILRTALAAAKYVQEKPDADIKEFDSNPEAFVKPTEKQ